MLKQNLKKKKIADKKVFFCVSGDAPLNASKYNLFYKFILLWFMKNSLSIIEDSLHTNFPKSPTMQ